LTGTWWWVVPSNTAERWWVRRAARWMARVQTVQGQLALLFQGMSGVGIASGALKYLGLPTPVIAGLFSLFVGGVVGYVYVYSEHGVHNQKERDMSDISTNYSQPVNYIDDVIIGAAVFAAREGRKPDAEERQAIEEAVEEQWIKYRDGIEIDE